MRAHTPGTKNHRLWQLDPTHTHRSEGHDPLMDARMQLARLVEKRLDIAADWSRRSATVQRGEAQCGSYGVVLPHGSQAPPQRDDGAAMHTTRLCYCYSIIME
jgi:hypothetical protein